MCFFFIIIRRPPRSTLTDTLFPYTTLFRSLRKNNMFALVQTGAEGIAKHSEAIHTLRLVKDDGHILFFVDGRKIIDWEDDGETYGPLYRDGKFGLRQMQWSHFRYRNFKVWSIKNN